MKFDRLSVSAPGGRQLLRETTLTVRRGEAIGVTGESGSGKTTLLKAAMGVLGRGCEIDGGGIQLDGRAMEKLPPHERRKLAGTSLGFVPQLPMTAFDSRIAMGRQIQAVYCKRLGLSREAATGLAREKLRQVNLLDAERVMGSRPGALSGGMLQRVAIAILLGLNPPFILADEPTSALDPDNRAAVIALLQDLKPTSGLLVVSHDTEVLGRVCDRVHVLHDGELVEEGNLAELLAAPKHDWTARFAETAGQREEGYWSWERW
ncbi:ATP-binding cassette domain-containing protein [Cohnella phaseoli]|uniref:Peptide/nickel transport system ATP-binding protein n=1 Tax=Cohnella phaseoli TaxID=456490 RepID=A0A3D9HR11_9BACL|nr:ATP-binding cassette domain-containing protein [Cohnella phaseoli]RED51910.1 peptide/nickel transport system ATP-binding protein [Cohnella phaseoli]